MNAVIASGRKPDLETPAREMFRRQTEEWFDWMDWILDVHRSNFVFREPSPTELEEHKTGLTLCLQTCRSIAAQLAQPEFGNPDLTAALKVRKRQLEDAFNTFHDSKLSDVEAERIKQQIFPE